MSRVPLMPHPLGRAARPVTRTLLATLAAGYLLLPAMVAADPAPTATPAAVSKPHTGKLAAKSVAAPTRSPYARAAAADAAERPHRSLTGRGQTAVPGTGHTQAKRAGAPTL